jgi:glucosyl-3-phosphoglycerate synthase
VGDEMAQKIATLFTGIPRETFEQVAREITLMPGARETVAALRKSGYLVGVVTDCYHVAAEIIRCRVFADFTVAHLMKFTKGKATGRIEFAPAMTPPADSEDRSHTRTNILTYLHDKLGLPPERVLAVGNGEEDIGMLKAAGQSVAFRPNRSAVRAAAQVVVEGALTDLVIELENQSEAALG